jgi:ABC-type multidrug transport system ATPase subunit
MTVRLRNAKKFYDGCPIVGGVSFGVGEDEVVGLVGPNESGKSTILSMITMDKSKTDGEIYLNDTLIENIKYHQFEKKLGLVAQNNIYWETMTVDENLEFFGSIKGLKKKDIELSKNFIKKTLKLDLQGKKKPYQLSRGN